MYVYIYMHNNNHNNNNNKCIYIYIYGDILWYLQNKKSIDTHIGYALRSRRRVKKNAARAMRRFAGWPLPWVSEGRAGAGDFHGDFSWDTH